MIDDFQDLIITFDQVKAELEEVEQELAIKHGIDKNIRDTLLENTRNGTLIEDELICKWHSVYSSYLEWIK